MSPVTKQHELQQTKPVRSMRRIVAGLMLAAVAWFGVRELVAPRPLERIRLDSSSTIKQVLRVGSWCLLEEPVHSSLDKLQILDLAKGTLTDQDTRFGSFHFDVGLVNHLKSSGQRYVLKYEGCSKLQIVDTETGSMARIAFPETTTLIVREEGDTLLEATPLPLAPLTALSPAPWSAISTSFLMSYDAQRLYQQAIGPELVQVRHIPDMKVLARYALPATVSLKHLRVTADGRYLLRAFGADRPPLTAPTATMENQERRMARLVVPRTLFGWKKLPWLFRVRFDQFAKRAQEKVTSVSDHKSKEEGGFTIDLDWMDIDLSNVWPDLDSRYEVYDALTGQLRYSRNMEHKGKEACTWCDRMLGSWAMFSRVSGFTPEADLPRLGALYLPTGKFVPEAELPAVLWGKSKTVDERVTEQQDGRLLIRTESFPERLNLPNNRIGSPTSNQFDRLGTNGVISSVRMIPGMGFPFYSLDKLIPHSHQMITGQIPLIDTLPDWLRSRIVLWPWLNQRLSRLPLSIIDVESGATLWNIPMPQSDFDQLSWSGHPQVIISLDGTLMLLQEDQKQRDVIYALYSLPISRWLRYWPWLASVVVFLLILSQGVRRRLSTHKSG